MRAQLACIAFATAVFVDAQCGMTTVITGGNGCFGGSFSVNSTGGQGPYSIVISPIPANQFSNLQFANDADGDVNAAIPWFPAQGASGWAASQRSTVTVTDVNGCVATAMSPFYCSVDPDPVWGHSDLPNCATGLTEIRVGFNQAGGAPPTYTLSGPISSSGTFASGWTNVGNSTWAYNTAVPNGQYGLGFSTWTTGSCSNVGGMQHCASGATWTIDGNVTPGDCGTNVLMRAALDGAMSTDGYMHDSLRVRGLLPTTEPYSALGYAYTNASPGLAMSPALLNVTGDNAVVDWVVVELRSSSNSSQVLYSRPALLQRDGGVMDLDGDNYVNFPSATGSYYVALRHRNHLGVMTSIAGFGGTDISAPGKLVDFKLMSGITTYGTNARVQKGNYWGLWAGDATGNGTIAYTGANNDRDAIILAVGGSTPNNTLNNVYDRRDTNLDGVIKYTGANNDRDIILTNVGSTTPNNTRTQQLP